MNSKLVFYSNCFKKPKEVAALAPSSRFVVKKILSMIDFDHADCLVEYGPGTGVITKGLLSKMKTNAKLLCFETNKKFCSFLYKKVDDKRLVIINDSAENLALHLKKLKIKNVDYVISGIPFSLIKKGDKKLIISQTRDSLRKGGNFIIYQYSQHIKKYLSTEFEKIYQGIVVRNLPPYFIFSCEKL